MGLLVAAVLAVLTGLRLAFLAWGGLDLSPDEAHYWEWSRRLDLSYYSKGPLIAYLIAGLTAVFGTSAFGIRLGAVAPEPRSARGRSTGSAASCSGDPSPARSR